MSSFARYQFVRQVLSDAENSHKAGIVKYHYRYAGTRIVAEVI